jgi:predicted PurR-regulated permease PerM
VAEPTPERRELDLAWIAAAVAVAIGVAAALLWFLLDIVIVLFLGIVVSAALQPAHARLVAGGVPRGIAVLLIYALFFSTVAIVGILVGPVAVEQLGSFASAIPQWYAETLASLRGSEMPLVRTIGQRVPSFDRLVDGLAGVAPRLSGSLVQLTTGLVTAFAYLVTVFVTGFYWTLELPRIERLVVSLLPVTRRPQALAVWHEIETKLGAFIRGQMIAMVAVGVASGVGYWAIGLPNVLALAALAALLEAVPLVGPVLAAVPAILAAVPVGATTVLLVAAWSILVQQLENNVLIPRIMSREVGMSPLLGLFAVLAFGTLYGIPGIFLAIPLAAVLQVIVDRFMVNGEEMAEPVPEAPSAEAVIQARVNVLRQRGTASVPRARHATRHRPGHAGPRRRRRRPRARARGRTGGAAARGARARRARLARRPCAPAARARGGDRTDRAGDGRGGAARERRSRAWRGRAGGQEDRSGHRSRRRRTPGLRRQPTAAAPGTRGIARGPALTDPSTARPRARPARWRAGRRSWTPCGRSRRRASACWRPRPSSPSTGHARRPRGSGRPPSSSRRSPPPR